MANEISVSVSFIAAKGGAAVSVAYAGSIGMAGEDVSNQTQTVGQTQSAMQVGIVAGAALLCVKNLMPATFAGSVLQDTNTLYIGATGVSAQNAYVIVRAGESALFRRGPAALYLISNTASTSVQVVAVEP